MYIVKFIFVKFEVSNFIVLTTIIFCQSLICPNVGFKQIYKYIYLICDNMSILYGFITVLTIPLIHASTDFDRMFINLSHLRD